MKHRMTTVVRVWSSWWRCALAKLGVVTAPVAPYLRHRLAGFRDGAVVSDIYLWVRNCRDLEIQNYITSENRYYDWYFKRDTLLKHNLKYLVNPFLPPLQSLGGNSNERHGNYDYFIRTPISGFPMIMRKNDGNEEQIVLDLNSLSQCQSDVTIGPLKVSSCDQFVACCIKDGIGDNQTLRVLTMKGAGHQSNLLATIRNADQAEWINGGSTVLYTTKSPSNRSDTLWIYDTKLNTSRIALKEKDERFTFLISKTKDGAYVILSSSSKFSTEVHAITATMTQNSADIDLILLHSRQNETECYVDHYNSVFYAMVIDQSGGEFVLKRSHSHSDNMVYPVQWEEFYNPANHGLHYIIHDFDVMSQVVLVYGCDYLVPMITVLDITSGDVLHHAKMSNSVQTLTPGINQDATRKGLYVEVSSPWQPTVTRELDLVTGMHDLVFPSDANGYTCSVINSQSKDGTMVPISVCHGTNIDSLDRAPMLVHVYGCYGALVDMAYDATKAALLACGWILAFAHVRGGGELGKRWHKDATLSNKSRTFEDLEGSLDCLHESGYSKPMLTAVKGASAGALAAAVLCNRRPDALGAAILKVPYLDVFSSMMDSGNPLTSLDFTEFGDPRSDAGVYDAMLSYCPYRNLKHSNAFPSVYLTASLHDRRVPYWVPLKWLAKWRHCAVQQKQTTSNNTVVCHFDEHGGHFGGTQVDRDEKMIDELVFLYRELSLGRPDVSIKQA